MRDLPMSQFTTFSLKNGALVKATGIRKWAAGKKDFSQTGFKETSEISETLRENDGEAIMQNDAPAGGTWEFTAVMVVIASWILYRYVAPQRWREWARAGLIQAFIIALYAEMYGFPLTIYVLSGFLGLDIPWLHQSGHLWATLFGWGHRGAMLEMLFGYAIVFFGISLLNEGWREVYQATQAKRLATNGLYGLVRHPQYTGIFLAIFGQLIHWPTIPTVPIDGQ